MNIPADTSGMKVVVLPLVSIDRSRRLRPVDPIWAQVIAQSMREHGQLSPVHVQAAKPGGLHRLIAGEHRCEARQINEATREWPDVKALTIDGQPAVYAIVLDVSDDEARLLEIDENLARADLNDLDRAIFMGERKRVYEKLHPQTKHGRASKKEKVANSATILRFTLQTAGLLKQSERTIQMLIHRDKHLTEAVKQRLRGTWIAKVGAELDAIARLKPDEQMPVVDVMLREDDPQPNVHAALVAVRGIQAKPKTTADEQFSKLLALWKVTGAEARKAFRDHIAKEDAAKKPAGRKAGA